MTERIIERVIGSMRDDLAARLAEGNPPEAGLSVMMLEPAQGPAGNVVLVHARNVVVAPALGLVLDGRSYTPLFAPAAQVPDAAIARTQARAARAGTLPRIARAALWCGAGAARNYGHFIFDGLTGLAALDARGLLTRYPPLGPRLTRWQRDLRALAGLAAAPDAAIRAPLIRVDELIYTDCLNYYLHRAGGLFAALAARFDAARSEIGAEAGAGGEDVVYLSRRGFTGRIVVNERALERALAACGARVLRPERLSVAAQARAMARAAGDRGQRRGAGQHGLHGAGGPASGTAPRPGARALDGAGCGGAGNRARRAGPRRTAASGRHPGRPKAAAMATAADGALSLCAEGRYRRSAGADRMRPGRDRPAFRGPTGARAASTPAGRGGTP